MDPRQAGYLTGNVVCLDGRKLGPGGTQRGYNRRPEQMEWEGVGRQR